MSASLQSRQFIIITFSVLSATVLDGQVDFVRLFIGEQTTVTKKRGTTELLKKSSAAI